MREDWFKRSKIPDQVVEFLLTVKIPLENELGVFQRDTREDLSINYDLVEEELQETPSMLAFYSSLYAEQKRKVAVVQRKIANQRGDITTKIVKDFADRGIKIRREDLKEIIEADNEMNTLQAQLILETLRLDKLKAVIEAIVAKNENLRSLAGFKRAEQQQQRS